MKGTDAIRMMLTYDEIDSITLPGSKFNRKRVICRKELSQSGIHVSALDLKQDSWQIDYAIENLMQSC